MATDPVYQRLLEASWRRALTAAEQAELEAWLQAHPEQRPDWESESSLSKAIAGLPDVPVPSNFTSVVLRAVELERAADARAQTGAAAHSWKRRLTWFLRLSPAALLLIIAGLAYHRVQLTERRDIAQSVAVVASVSSLPNPKILEDFDAIRAMNSTPAADEQLLQLFQ